MILKQKKNSITKQRNLEGAALTSLLVLPLANKCRPYTGEHISWDVSTHWPLGELGCLFKTAIFNLVLSIGIFTSSNDNPLRWMPWDLTDDKSTLVQVMAWCRLATSHYLNQCWPSSMSPYGVTKPQCLLMNICGNLIFEYVWIMAVVIYLCIILSHPRHLYVYVSMYMCMYAYMYMCTQMYILNYAKSKYLPSCSICVHC